jgi:hypothetical protein
VETDAGEEIVAWSGRSRWTKRVMVQAMHVKIATSRQPMPDRMFNDLTTGPDAGNRWSPSGSR